MDVSRIAAILAYLTLEEVPGFFRGLALFQTCGVLSPADAAAWHDAVRAKVAELSEPRAEA